MRAKRHMPALGANDQSVRQLLAQAAGLTAEQVADLAEHYRANRNLAWLQATASAWRVARQKKLQSIAEDAHNLALRSVPAHPGRAEAAEAAAFAVLAVVLRPHLPEKIASALEGPWQQTLGSAFL